MDKFGLLSIVFGSAFCVVFVIKLLGYLWGRYSDDLKTDKSLKTTVLVWGIVIFFFFSISCFEQIIIHLIKVDYLCLVSWQSWLHKRIGPVRKQDSDAIARNRKPKRTTSFFTMLFLFFFFLFAKTMLFLFFVN